MLNIFDKDFFKTEFGRRMASRHFGLKFDEPKSPVSNPARKIEDEVVAFASPPVPSSLTNSPSLHDLVTFFRGQGIVGEENLLCGATLAAINKSSFGVEGFSGSGKTFVVNKLVQLLPDVYTYSQGSDLAIFHDAARVNKSQFLYIPELQKAMQKKNAPIIEIIKDVTEGRDANRLVTSKNGQGVVEYRIKNGVCIIYTLAAENDYKKDEESARRFIRFRTDASSEHLEAIHEYKARQRYDLGGEIARSSSLERMLKQHVDECLRLGDVVVVDPFASYMGKVIPRTQKSVGYVDHYYALLDGCTKFHFNQRTSFDHDDQRHVLVNIEDHFNVHRIYFDEFIASLNDFGSQVSAQQPDWAACFNSACQVVQGSPELGALRRLQSHKVDQWFESQTKDKALTTLDYRSGQRVAIYEHA